MLCKGQKHKLHYTEEDVEKAVEKVRTGNLSYWQAHEIYGVPKSTISDKINRHCVKLNLNKPRPDCHLLPEIEECIYKWLLKMARIGYGQTKPGLFDRMQIIIRHLKIMMPFVDDHLGEKWYRRFLACFPNLALWQAQLLSKLHAGVSQQAFNDWFQELQEYLFKTGNIDILEHPNRIYNCDETGFLMAPCPSKGDPHMYQQGASTEAQITLLLTTSATAHYIPPSCGLSRAKFLNNIYQGVLPNFPRCSVWTLTIRMDGSGPVLQLARAKLHPQN